MSVKVDRLSKNYGSQIAVNQLSFEAKAGEILGFLGPNGAGKSTTMKMICCYTPPSSGSAVVNGYNINNSPLQVRKQIGYLPEHNPLYEEMYIKEYLQFVASIHKIEKKTSRISDVIQMTGLEKEQNKIIGTLSKGYRQRVGLAQAIIHDPQVLILDEPTSGLDMNQLIDIRNLIKALGKEKTVIFSSHIMQEVQALCDRVVIINNGELVADESIDKLSKMVSGSQIVKVGFDERNINIEPFKSIIGVEDVVFVGGMYQFAYSNDKDIRKEIFKTAVSNHYTIIEMKQDQANFEDVFRKLTKKPEHV